MNTSPFHPAVRWSLVALDGLARATGIALSLFVIAAVAAVAFVVTTNVHLALPGIVDIWTESYRDSPSIAFRPHGIGIVSLFVATTAVLAIAHVRASLRR